MSCPPLTACEWGKQAADSRQDCHPKGVLPVCAPFHDSVALFGVLGLFRRRRYLDVQFFKMQMADPKSVVARKTTSHEQKMVLQERIGMFKACIASPDKPIDAPYLFTPKEAVSMTGGTVERQRSVRG